MMFDSSFPPQITTPNADARIKAVFNQDLSVEIEATHAEKPTEPYVVTLSRETGTDRLLLKSWKGDAVTTELRDGMNHHVFRLRAGDTLLYPGTYVLRFLKSGQEIGTKYFTVDSTPQPCG